MKECPASQTCHEDSLEHCPLDGHALEPSLAGSPVLDGKYRLDRRLGGGGMGVVYLAWHQGIRRHVALKVLRPEREQQPRVLARFQREAEALGGLKHAHIVDVTDYGVDPREGGVPYLAMEHLEGTSLGARLRAGPMSLAETVAVLEPVAAALDFAHAAGILHRDVKPDNVFLAHGDAGQPPRVKLLDFGIARRGQDERAAAFVPPPSEDGHGAPETTQDADLGTFDLATIDVGPSAAATGGADLTEAGMLVGTPHYMAPELWRGGPPSRASDIYALAIMAFEMLAGERPYSGTLAAIARGHLEGAAPEIPRADVAPGVDAVLQRGLARDPGARPPSARAFVEALRAVEADDRARRWRRREVPRRLAAALALSLLVTAAAAAAGSTSLGRRLEGATEDARFTLLPKRAPDPRVVLVMLDDASLDADGRPLADQAEEFARRLEGLFTAGARGVALDLLLGRTWSASPGFSRWVLGHRDAVALGVSTSPDGRVVGPEAIEGLTAAALGERATDVLAFADVEDDTGRARRARALVRDREGRLLHTLAGRAAAMLGVPALTEARFPIDRSVDWRAVPVVRWLDLAGEPASWPAHFRDRLVIVGASYHGSGDVHRTASGELVPGVVVQALIVDTLLAGRPIREAPRAVGMAVGLIAALAVSAALLLGIGIRRLVSGVVVVSIAFLATSLAALHAGHVLVPVVVPIACALAGGALATALRVRAFKPREIPS